MPGEEVLHSRRTLSLRFDIPISRTHEFWDALKEGRLVTTKCTKCGNVTFPPQADCPKCSSSEFGWVDLGTEAKLLTYTQVLITPASFADSDPYIIAIGKLANGLNVLAWLEGTPLESVKPGMAMRLEPRSSKEGNPYYVFVAA